MLWSNLPTTSKVSAKRGIVYDWKKSHVIFHKYVHCIIVVGILGLILDMNASSMYYYYYYLITHY